MFYLDFLQGQKHLFLPEVLTANQSTTDGTVLAFTNIFSLILVKLCYLIDTLLLVEIDLTQYLRNSQTWRQIETYEEYNLKV